MRKKDLMFILASKVYYSLAVNVQKVGYRLDTKTKKGEIGHFLAVCHFWSATFLSKKKLNVCFSIKNKLFFSS